MNTKRLITWKMQTDLRPLENLKEQLKQNILRAAVRKATNITKSYLKASDVDFTGTYRKSISVKISARKPGLVTGVCGPRSSYEKTFPGKKKPRVVKPVKYSFFLEKGSVRSKAREPIKKSFHPAESQAIMTATIAERIQRALSK